LALDATLTGGALKAIARGGAKGGTTAADVTSTGQSVDRQALDVQIRTSTGVAVDSFGGGTQFADGAARGAAVGTLMMGDDGTLIQAVNVDTQGRLNLNNIAGTVTLPTGAATSALQTQPGVDIGDVTINNAAGAAAVNIQDGGNSITVDGTVSIAGTVPVSATALPLPTGAATETSLATRLADATFTTRINTLGQKAMAASTPVTLASDQSALAITAAALPLPTGAATETTLAALNTKTPALGQALMVASVPVTIASNQSNLGVVGAAANGAVATGNPVLAAGSDGTIARTLRTDAVGNLRVTTPARTRVSIIFQAAAPSTIDTLLTLVKNTNGVPAVGATSIAVTATRILRITAITASIQANAAAAAFGTLNLRVNPTAAAVLASPSELRVDLGNTEAVIGAARAITIPIPDGFELTGAAQLACSFAAQAITNIISITLTGYEY
jgi:hypothetical protein